MRYEKPESIVRLALRMQGTAEGVSLDDIRDEFGVSRRTAERMRDAVRHIFPVDETRGDDGFKRWRVPPGIVRSLVHFSADELADMEMAINLLEQESLPDQAQNLKNVATKIRGLMKHETLRTVEPDLEALIEAEGFAMRPGPRPTIDRVVFEVLRNALKGSRKVEIHYLGRSSGAVSRQRVCPYGFLWGDRHYLVAFSLNSRVRDYRLFALANISKVVLLEEWFTPKADFSLKKYAEQSFRIFQEEPFDVVWKFSKLAAKDAEDFFFHPSQQKERLDDGSLIVKFRAGGALEMAWHLAIWNNEVEVLEPADFWERVEEQRDDLWGQEEE